MTGLSPRIDTIEQTAANLFLPNYRLLSSSSFPDTTGLYVWPVNGASDASTISNTVGGLDLTRVGALTSAANHLGSTVYNTLDGTNDCLYAAGTTFDTTNESFTVGGWFKFNDVTNYQVLVSKAVNGADQSFWAYVQSGTLFFQVRYSSGTLQIPTSCSVASIADGYHHHISFLYDTSDGSIAIIIDGKVAGYNKNSNIQNARSNTANCKLTFGGYGNGSLSGGPFNGSISDCFYKKSAMSIGQIRKLYVTGTKKLGYVDELGRTKISGEIVNMDLTYSLAGLVTGTPTAITLNANSTVTITRDASNRWFSFLDLEWSCTTTTLNTLIFSGMSFLQAGRRSVAVNNGYYTGAGGNVGTNIEVWGITSSNAWGITGMIELTGKPTWAIDLTSVY